MYCVTHDCDDLKPHCATDCTDADADDYCVTADCDEANPNCTTDCTDADADGYCVTTDCDDNRTHCTTDCTDADGDEFCVTTDCDDLTASCTTDCTDADDDGMALCAGDCNDLNPYCDSDCTDTDHDGYCVTTDCDDNKALCTTDCTDTDGDGYCVTTDCDDTVFSCTTSCDDFDDDGLVVWLNGVEIFRSATVPAGPLDWNSAVSEHESSNGPVPLYEEYDVSTTGVPVLVQGENLLAVAVWNTAATDDLVLLPRLILQQESPAVDAGHGDAPHAATEDLDGDGRPNDSNRDGIARPDVGADERW